MILYQLFYVHYCSLFTVQQKNMIHVLYSISGFVVDYKKLFLYSRVCFFLCIIGYIDTVQQKKHDTCAI